MAYNAANLSALAYANGFTMWHYKTTDASATVDTANYFNSAAKMLRQNDIIFGVTSDKVGLFYVKDHDGTNVDVADILQIGGTDTD